MRRSSTLVELGVKRNGTQDLNLLGNIMGSIKETHEPKLTLVMRLA